MKTGNPKQALVLGTVALVVVTMAVMRVIPSSPAPTRQAPTATEPSTPEEHAASALEPIATQDLSNDPFSHPELYKGDDTNTNQAPASGDTGADPADPKPSQEFQIPFKPGFGPVIPGVDGTVQPDGTAAKPGTDEIAGKGQESQGAEQPKRKLMLQAIVNAGQAQGFIEFAGTSGRYGIADKIDGLGTVVFISDEKMVILSGKRKITLRVGQEVEL